MLRIRCIFAAAKKTPMLPTNKAEDYSYIPPREFNELFTMFSDIVKWHDLLLWKPAEPTILAACEDPETLLEYVENSTGRKFPLEQTDQMSFEYELLNAIKNNIAITGLYGITLSNRDEVRKRNPNRVMHKKFQMFELGYRGDFNHLLSMFSELVINTGVNPEHIAVIDYVTALQYLKKPVNAILSDEDEIWLNENVAPCVFLTHFPERTNPFWNMKRKDGFALKCDIILGGMEVAGGAERETKKEPQLAAFNSLPNYKEKLFFSFGKERVYEELNYYFSLLSPLAIRSGAGIGMSRYHEALKRYKQKH